MTIKKKTKIKVPGVYLDKNGTYYIKHNNRTYRGFKGVKEAKAKKSELELAQEENTSNITLNELATLFLIDERVRVDTEEITYGTYDKKRSALELYVSPRIGKLKLKNITPAKIRTFRNEIAQLELSSEHKNIIIGTTKNLLKYGVKFHGLAQDYDLFLERVPKTKEEIKRQKERFEYIWNDDDFEKFLSHVKKDNLKLTFKLFFKHGLRLGEAIALRWCDVDFENKRISINGSITKKTKSKKKERSSTKTQSSIRDIYIGSTRTKEFKQLKEVAERKYGFNEEWYVLGFNKPLPEKTIENNRNKACDDAGLKRVWNHDMRHMFVTNSWSKVPLTALSRYIGHKNVAVTLQRYSHLSQKDSTEFNDFIENSK